MVGHIKPTHTHTRTHFRHQADANCVVVDVDTKKDNQVTNGLVVGVNRAHTSSAVYTMSPNRDKWLNTQYKKK